MTWIQNIKRLDKQVIRIAYVFTLLSTLLNMGLFFAEDYAPDRTTEWGRIILNELTGGFAMFVLMIPLLAFYHTYKIEKKSWYKDVGLHFLASAIYAIVFVSIMYGLRWYLYPVFELRTFEVFNNMHIRFLMEYFKLFIFYWIGYTAYYLYTLNNNRQEQELAMKDLQTKLVQTELQALQTRLNPHFFFNTLNTVSSMMYDSPEKADKLIVQLSGFLRKVMGFVDEPMHSITDEIELTKQYLDLMKARYEDNLIVEEDIKLNSLLENLKIPALTFQPLLENAIQYSIDYQIPAKVKLSIYMSDQYVICKVEDNGPGVADESNIEKGIGLKTVIDRLDKLFGAQFTYKITNRKPSGLVVQFNIPLNQ